MKTEFSIVFQKLADAHDISLSILLSMVAEATRELCAEFPQFNCHNGATNDWQVAKKVAAHIEANYK